MTAVSVGVDFGGTKIEAAALSAGGEVVARQRQPTPRSYDEALDGVAALVGAIEKEAGRADRLGLCMPGSVSPRAGLMRNVNATYLNGRRFGADLSARLRRPVALANDANCLAVSEATDGAATGAAVVFAAVLGTGCGGGLAIHGRVISGANGIAGEWGHSPLPSPQGRDELAVPRCWCGSRNCVELWTSGTALRRTYRERAGVERDGAAIISLMRAGDRDAVAVVDAWLDRLARALAGVVNILDPNVLVFGGGMSNVPEIYARLPALMRPHIFADFVDGAIAAGALGRRIGRPRRSAPLTTNL